MHGNMKETTHSMFAPCPYFENLMGEELKARYLVIILKVVASRFQRFSRDIIPFDIKHCDDRDYQRQCIIKEEKL